MIFTKNCQLLISLCRAGTEFTGRGISGISIRLLGGSCPVLRPFHLILYQGIKFLGIRASPFCSLLDSTVHLIMCPVVGSDIFLAISTELFGFILISGRFLYLPLFLRIFLFDNFLVLILGLILVI